MHAAVDAQTNAAKRFITQPWAMAFKHKADEGYVVSSASNIVVKVKLDAGEAAPTVQSDPATRRGCSKFPPAKIRAASWSTRPTDRLRHELRLARRHRDGS